MNPLEVPVNTTIADVELSVFAMKMIRVVDRVLTKLTIRSRTQQLWILDQLSDKLP